MSKRKSSGSAAPPEELEELKARLDRLESKLVAAKAAYLSRSALDGVEMTYERLVAVATDYVNASYALQKRRFGSIKVRLSIAKLLR